MITPGGHGLGRKPHKPLQKEYGLEKTWPLIMPKALPPSIDNLVGLNLPPIFNQGTEGSCTANAGVRWLYFMCEKYPEFLPCPPPSGFSRQALYWWERNLPWNQDTGSDAGAQSRDIFWVLEHIGACAEHFDPYDPSTLTNNPGPEAVEEAAQYRITGFHTISSLADLKGCLASSHCFTLGFMAYASFDSVGADGIWSPNTATEPMLGGHEVLVRGFDDSVNGGSFYCDNSWGSGWGKVGSFYMPFSFIENATASQWDAFTGPYLV